MQHYMPEQEQEQEQGQAWWQPTQQQMPGQGQVGGMAPAGVAPLDLEMETVTPRATVMGSTALAGSTSERDEKLEEAAKLMLGSADDWEGYVGIVRPGAVIKNQHKERYLKLADGSLQLYERQGQTNPVRQDLIRAIRSIRWSGVEVHTPLECFRMYYSPGKRTATAEDPEKTHRLFQALAKYNESKMRDPELKNHFVPDDDLNGCMQVGELPDGRVIYRPQEGMLAEERDNDILRLAIAINLVEEEALKAELNFAGWVAKSSRSEGGGRNKERYLKVGDGHLSFHDDAKTVKPRKMIGVSTIQSVLLWQLTIVTEYDTFKLCNTPSNPGALGALAKKLEATHALITGDLLRSYSTAFDAFDVDNDGTLTREEIYKYLGDHKLVEQFFQEIDVNADGSISREEFMRAVEARQRTFMGEDGKLKRIEAAVGEADSVPDQAAAQIAGEEMQAVPLAGENYDGGNQWSGVLGAGISAAAPYGQAPHQQQILQQQQYGGPPGHAPAMPQQTGGSMTLDI
jgi:Ca2+-binding EF-hand superfamily protein